MAGGGGGGASGAVAGAPGSQRNSGEGPIMEHEKELWRKQKSLNRFVFTKSYLIMAVTGIGYLALMWSTVVLLGGFVTTLGKKDFWCITAISMVQAARIFNNWGEGAEGPMVNFASEIMEIFYQISISGMNGVIIAFLPLIVLLLVVFEVMLMILLFGSFICAGISLWRMIQRDYGKIHGDSTKANLMPGLDIFYSLVIFQSALYFLWFTVSLGQLYIVASFTKEGVFEFTEKWWRRSVLAYIGDSQSKCWRDPKSIKTRSLIKYAADLLDSESSQDYLSGSRILGELIKRGVDVGTVIHPSRQKVQKLIDTLRCRSRDREVRELSARILAHIASDIDLTLFPGAIRCISSLLDTTLPYWNIKQGYKYNPAILEEARFLSEQQDCIYDSGGDRWNELILQGLNILEKLASDQHNCRDICSTPGLIPKIMAPIYSDTLIKNVNMMAWHDIVNRMLRLVHQLICVPEWTGQRLAHEISSSKQALNNLDSLLDLGNKAGKELQMQAIEILTEMTLDSSTNLKAGIKENLIKKLLQIFLNDDEAEEEKLRLTAGKTLGLLSKIENINVFIMKEQSNIFYLLSGILDAKNSITYKTVALEVLENLCTHCILDENYVKESLLPKILAEVMASKRDLPKEEIEISELDWMLRHSRAIVTSVIKRLPTKKHVSGPRGDEEKQLVSKHSSQIKSGDQTDEQLNAEMEFRDALLSLTLVLCGKLISADDFDEVARKAAPGEGEFVAKLKIIVEEHCEATANSLRIVKLCGQIAVTMMRRSQYTAHFKEKKFVETLAEASQKMCNLESCMLFAGTDGGAKTGRGLLWEVVKEAQAMVA